MSGQTQLAIKRMPSFKNKMFYLQSIDGLSVNSMATSSIQNDYKSLQQAPSFSVEEIFSLFDISVSFSRVERVVHSRLTSNSTHMKRTLQKRSVKTVFQYQFNPNPSTWNEKPISCCEDSIRFSINIVCIAFHQSSSCVGVCLQSFS